MTRYFARTLLIALALMLSGCGNLGDRFGGLFSGGRNDAALSPVTPLPPVRSTPILPSQPVLAPQPRQAEVGILNALAAEGPIGTYAIGPEYMLGAQSFRPFEDLNYREEGNASWYGPGLAGNRTANGELFNPNAHTAAHRTLPFSSVVKVTNPANGIATIVRINDRGPFIPNHVIDLSQRAANDIGLRANQGNPVIVEILEPETRKLAEATGSFIGNNPAPAFVQQPAAPVPVPAPTPTPAPAQPVGVANAQPAINQTILSQPNPSTPLPRISSTVPLPTAIPSPQPVVSPQTLTSTGTSSGTSSGLIGTPIVNSPSVTTSSVVPLSSPTITTSSISSPTPISPTAISPTVSTPVISPIPAPSVSNPGPSTGSISSSNVTSSITPTPLPAPTPIPTPTPSPAPTLLSSPSTNVSSAAPVSSGSSAGTPTASLPKGHYIQAGSFSSRTNAEQLRDKISNLGSAIIQSDGGSQKVMLGPFTSRGEAMTKLGDVIAAGGVSAFPVEK